MDDVRGGIFQGLATDGTEIAAKGGWMELGVQATPWWLTVLGGSLDDPDDDDLTSIGALSRDKNLIFYWANRFRFGPLEIGADYLHWKTEFLGPNIEDGEDDRFNLFLAYWF